MGKYFEKNSKQFRRLNCNSKASKQPSIDVLIQHYKENLNQCIIENKQNRMYSTTQQLKINSSENKQLDRSVIQYKLQNNAQDSTAQDILVAAGEMCDYTGWLKLDDFKLFENVSPVINFTLNVGSIGVTIDGAPAQGSPFDNMMDAIIALKRQVFVSFDNDKQMGFYNWVATLCSDIRYEFVEKEFEETFPDTTLETSIKDTISSIDLSGSNRSEYSRHDFQDSRKEVMNLQIQLGGSRAFGTLEKFRGKTSETLVVIDTSVWDILKRENPNRLRCMIQEAHRKSFNEKAKIQISSFVQPQKGPRNKK